MIKIEHLSKIYNRGHKNEFYALNDISLEIADGEMVAIIGKSGAGKSTLMNILGCIDDYEIGSYYLDGQDIGKIYDSEKAMIRNQIIGIVLQEFELLEKYSVIENVLLPYDFSPNKVKKKMQMKRALDILEKVEMIDFQNQRVSTLSGGQKQRVAIARAMIMEPNIILADEPTGALDEESSKMIIDLLRMLNNDGVTIVMITHEMDIAKKCDRIIEIKDGRIIGE